MYAGIVSTTLFCAKNLNNVGNGHDSKWLPASGQLAKLGKEINKYDNAISRGTKSAVDALKGVVKNEKVFEYAGKAIDLASKSINPLICASAGVDVLMADDKESALITNTAAVASMFAVEGLMKKHLKNTLKDVSEIKGMDKITEEVMRSASKYKHGGKLPAIIEGATFVLGSGLAYNFGQKFGSLVAKQVKSAEMGDRKAA